MPKYAALIYTSAEEQGQGTPEELEQVMNEYNDFTQAAAQAGVMIGGEALHDTNTATTVHIPNGKGGEPVFTDGPFAETKEALGGFYLFEVADLDEALKWAQQIPGAWYGRVEVRPIVEFEGQPEG
ncbi:MAG TPA: YciI family protein [Acidimicrobiia bacterium]|nr:YciI family protein [Acidimicrobiia bacterium]